MGRNDTAAAAAAADVGLRLEPTVVWVCVVCVGVCVVNVFVVNAGTAGMLEAAVGTRAPSRPLAALPLPKELLPALWLNARGCMGRV